MEEGAEKRARERSERLNAWMYHFRSAIVFQHVVEIMESLYYSSLVVIVSELARMNSLIVFV